MYTNVYTPVHTAIVQTNKGQRQEINACKTGRTQVHKMFNSFGQNSSTTESKSTELSLQVEIDTVMQLTAADRIRSYDCTVMPGSGERMSSWSKRLAGWAYN